MNILGQYLDAREDRQADQDAAERDRSKAADAWATQSKTPEERLLAFDRWVRTQLETRLDWAWAGGRRERRIEQCRIQLEQLVIDLWRRGWMLDGKRLAKHITDLLDAVARYQQTGKIGDFWSYFTTAVDRYVGANAEELKAEAMRAGSHMGHLVSALGLQAARTGPAIPELVACRAAEIAAQKEQTLREKLARQRAQEKAARDQLPLL